VKACLRRRWACQPPSGCQNPAGSGCTSSDPRPAAACEQGRDAERICEYSTDADRVQHLTSVGRAWQAAQPTGWQGNHVQYSTVQNSSHLPYRSKQPVWAQTPQLSHSIISAAQVRHQGLGGTSRAHANLLL
jgi:hypothetical protein